MQNLLDKIKILEYKYQKLKELDTFNIFTILLNATDEVNLHSQFLFTLLNPNGSHKKDIDFLKIFVQICGIEDFRLNDVKVFKEYKKIDLLIRNKKQAIIVENKINASDQDKQLERYYEILKKESVNDIKIVYLTLEGREPSEISLGTLQEKPDLDKLLVNISYKYHVKTWIGECIKVAALHSSLRETLNQYQKLIGELTGTTMARQEYLEIIELLSHNDNILQAHKITSNWNHVKWHTEYDFWCDLEKIITQEYEILNVSKFSEELITKVVHYPRNRNPWYGLMFVFKETENYKYCIYIERSDGNLYYGLLILDSKEQRINCNNEEFNELADRVEEFTEWHKSEFWIGGNYLEPNINFEAFGNTETMKILNKEFRTIYLQDTWTNIKGFIKKCVNVL